jgi:hypothetical protein
MNTEGADGVRAFFCVVRGLKYRIHKATSFVLGETQAILHPEDDFFGRSGTSDFAVP